MKILFHFPEFGNVAQNRQYQDNNSQIYPVLLAMQATWLHENGHAVYWDEPLHKSYDHIIIESKFATHQKTLDLVKDYPQAEILGECTDNGVSRLCPREFTALPFPNRRLTKWENYSRNGNYKYLPGTHVQAARDCWYGRCTFCSWAQLYPREFYSCRTPENLLEEIIQCRELGVREVFDDSGTFPVGDFLHNFCELMIRSGTYRDIRISCNMRFGACNASEFEIMRNAGFRMLLWGLEQYDPYTLMMLNKGIALARICDDLVKAKRAGLENHVAVMYGFPWVMPYHEEVTRRFVWDMMRQGIIDSVQATVFMPYPNTPLYRTFKSHHMLKTEDWAKYNMRYPIINLWQDPKQMVKQTYRLALRPQFLMRKLLQIRSLDDLKYYWRALSKIRGRI